MSYIKQNFQDGNVLSASQLNHMETGIEDAHSAVQTANATAQAASISASNAVTQAQSAVNTANEAKNMSAGKQDMLVSGVNIKTINGQDLLGEGNITVEGGGGSADLTGYLTKDEASTTYASKTDLQGKQEVLVSGTNIKKINGRSLLGSGNIVIEGGAGGTESGYIAELNGDEVCDYYAINKSGEHVLATGYGCTSYIDCYGCGQMEITNIQRTSATNYGIAFYDENKTFLSFVGTLVGSETKSVLQTIEIPSEAHYFRATFFNYEQQQQYGEFACTLVYQNDLVSQEGKRPYQDGMIFFSQKVNQSITRYWDTDEVVTNEGIHKATTGVLMLPKTYTNTGKKTPVILYAHGLSHYVYYGAWGATEEFLVQKQHWLDMGFAVMDCNGARDNNRTGTFATGICPQGVNAYKQCVDYVLKNYNVDSEVFLVAGSAGGAIGWNFLNMYPSYVKAGVFVATWSDFQTSAWGGGGAQTKNLYVEYLGFNDTSTYETDKTIGFDQKLRIITINSKPYCFMPANIPLYGIYGSKDTGNWIAGLKNTFTALRNAGAPAQIRCINGVGHEIVSGGNIVVDTEIGNWLLSHLGRGAGSIELPEVVYHTITYLYVDESGNTVKTSTTEQVKDGTAKTFSAPAITGYTAQSASPASATVTADMTVTFTYKAVVTHTVTYSYVTADGTAVKESTTETVNDGTQMTFTNTAPSVTGYDFVSVMPESATITSNITVTYTYEEVVEEPVDPSDLSSLFSWEKQGWMAVSNPQWKSSSNFMSCFADLSAYAGETIRVTVPQYTNSSGGISTGVTLWCTQPIENKTYIHKTVKVWDVDTNGNGKGVLVEIETVVPAEAPYLWTSTYMDGVAAYVGPNSGREDFRCYVVD